MVRFTQPPYGTLDAAEWAPSTASSADICAAIGDVRFAPNSDRESGPPEKVKSALLPEADLCDAPTHFRFGPKADIGDDYDRSGSNPAVRGKIIAISVNSPGTVSTTVGM